MKDFVVYHFLLPWIMVNSFEYLKNNLNFKNPHDNIYGLTVVLGTTPNSLNVFNFIPNMVNFILFIL